MLTLWGGGHIGLSRMEQSYCTSGFFRQRVTARNYSNYQPTPKHRSIIAYGKHENARRDKCVAVCVIWFIFSAVPFTLSKLSWERHSALFSRFCFLFLFFVCLFVFVFFLLACFCFCFCFFVLFLFVCFVFVCLFCFVFVFSFILSAVIDMSYS